MIYLIVLGFALCAIIKIFQGQTEMFFMYAVISSLFSISATIDSVYQRWCEREDAKLKAVGQTFKDLGEKLKEDKKKMEEDMKKSGDTSDKKYN